MSIAQIPFGDLKKKDEDEKEEPKNPPEKAPEKPEEPKTEEPKEEVCEDKPCPVGSEKKSEILPDFCGLFSKAMIPFSPPADTVINININVGTDTDTGASCPVKPQQVRSFCPEKSDCYD